MILFLTVQADAVRVSAELLHVFAIGLSSFNISCLFGFNVAFNHLRSYHDGAGLLQWYFGQCAATHKCHAADT